MKHPYEQDSCILDPASVRDVSDEKKEYYATHGYVPYRVGGSHIKWAQKGQAVREIQGYISRHRRQHPLQELRFYYARMRAEHGCIKSALMALGRFFSESRWS